MDPATENADNSITEIHQQATPPTTKQLGCISIDRHMLPAKISNFLNMTRFALTEYMVIFYMSIGFTASEAGWIQGLQYIGTVVAAPLWGLLADRTNAHR